MRFTDEEVLYEIRGPKSLFEMSVPELEKEIGRTEIALLACGSTEPHGPHLPLGADVLQGFYLLRKIVRRLEELGVRALAGPTIPFGLRTNLFERPQPWPGNLYLSAPVYRELLYELCMRFIEMGFSKIGLVVSHVENEPIMHTVAKELADHRGTRIVVANWVKPLWNHYKEILRSKRKEGHAGEGETARVMAVAPRLVNLEGVKPYYPAATEEAPIEEDTLPYFGGSVGIYFPWRHDTANPGFIGDPNFGTAEVGEKTYDVMADWIAGVFKKYLT
jgi:creatinine amidohydrolase